MNKGDLIRLKRLINKELNKRKRLEQLLNDESVKEYLELTNTKAVLNNLDEQNILKYILENFEVKETNDIYVCTTAFYTYFKVCYEDTELYSTNTDINSKHATDKIYTNIESRETVCAKRIPSDYITTSIDEFEENNIVLNPYNKCDKANGFNEVRLEFFENCLKYGQDKSKTMLLTKYHRI